MRFIETLDYSKLLSLIFETKHNINVSLPGIDEELADALIQINDKVTVNVLFDNSEESIRNGYGDLKGIDKLKEAGVHLKECNGNLVSFIISDEQGYFLFPQSKIFSAEPVGPNAVKIDPVTIQLLLLHFFPSDEISNKIITNQSDAITESVSHFQHAYKEIDEHGTNTSSINFDEKKYNDIKKRLLFDPPFAPDLQRRINTYQAKVQFIELKFVGGNIESKIAQLPKKALPINSTELKQLLMTRIKMFQDISKNPKYIEFQKFKKKVEDLREKYLIPITCRPAKSIIKFEEKEKFKIELESLQKEAANLNEILCEMLEKEKMNTKKIVKSELVTFFNNNPPEEVLTFKDKIVKQDKVNEIIETIIVSIKFPEVKKLIENISIKDFYFDLTWLDFSDDALLNEFSKKKIIAQQDIDSIVEMKEAFRVRKMD